MPATDSVQALRRFNRLYTRQIGLLNEHLSASPFSLTEARVLFELAHRDAPTAADVARDLGLDPAHMSRMVARFRTKGLVTATPSAGHAKRLILALTPAGHEAFRGLDHAADREAAAMLEALGERHRNRMMLAVGEIGAVLAHTPQADAAAFTLRAPRPGDLGHIIERQAVLYADEYGWDWTYEGLVADILGRFVAGYDPAREQCWVAERDGAMIGCIFLVKAEDATPGIGQLRLLYVEPSARGLGVGAALVDACVARAREAGYRRLVLWTNTVLTSARRIYEAAGFTLESEEPHHSFGHDLIGQMWELDL